MIMLKTQELAIFILGKTKQIDFDKPVPDLVREDSREDAKP